jgi:hypothetical protein
MTILEYSVENYYKLLHDSLKDYFGKFVFIEITYLYQTGSETCYNFGTLEEITLLDVKLKERIEKTGNRYYFSYTDVELKPFSRFKIVLITEEQYNQVVELSKNKKGKKLDDSDEKLFKDFILLLKQQ